MIFNGKHLDTYSGNMFTIKPEINSRFSQCKWSLSQLIVYNQKRNKKKKDSNKIYRKKKLLANENIRNQF